MVVVKTATSSRIRRLIYMAVRSAYWRHKLPTRKVIKVPTICIAATSMVAVAVRTSIINLELLHKAILLPMAWETPTMPCQVVCSVMPQSILMAVMWCTMCMVLAPWVQWANKVMTQVVKRRLRLVAAASEMMVSMTVMCMVPLVVDRVSAMIWLMSGSQRSISSTQRPPLVIIVIRPKN